VVQAKRVVRVGSLVIVWLLAWPGSWAGPPSDAAVSAEPERQAVLANWPGFRGPFGQAVCSGRQPPLDWDGASGRNVLWKVPVPLPGNSSPVVWSDRVFLTGATEEKRQVYCFDANTGQLRWQRSVENVPGAPAKSPEVLPEAGYAPATAACDERHVVALFANADLACFDLHGSRLWARNLGPLKVDYALASSPLLHDGRLFLQIDEREGGRVLAFDVKTGRIIWQKRRRLKSCWSSPLLARVRGQWQLVVNGNPSVTAYDPATGRQLWQVKCLDGEVTASPAFCDGLIVVAQDYAACVAIDGRTGQQRWRQEDLDLPDVPSPVAARGRVFIPTSFGPFACLQLETGETVWTHEFDEGAYASPVIVDDKVFLMDLSGRMHIFLAADSFRPVATPALGEPSNSTPAFVGNRIYIRSRRHLFCVGTRPQAAGQTE